MFTAPIAPRRKQISVDGYTEYTTELATRSVYERHEPRGSLYIAGRVVVADPAIALVFLAAVNILALFLLARMPRAIAIVWCFTVVVRRRQLVERPN